MNSHYQFWKISIKTGSRHVYLGITLPINPRGSGFREGNQEINPDWSLLSEIMMKIFQLINFMLIYHRFLKFVMIFVNHKSLCHSRVYMCTALVRAGLTLTQIYDVEIFQSKFFTISWVSADIFRLQLLMSKNISQNFLWTVW